MSLREAIARASEGREVEAPLLEAAFGEIMDGKASPVQIAALLVALRTRGETPAEIVAAARAMRARAETASAADPRTVDTCGTGGDGAGTFNVSTAAAFVVAGAGVPVAKHGNVAASSQAGSIDVLRALGVHPDFPISEAPRILEAAGIAPLFARRAHPAMRHVAPVRQELGIRTIFNCLGPLLNPLGVRRQVIGVYAPALVETLARALGELGSERALVVHGEDGLDEITTTAPTRAALLRDGAVETLAIDPAALGIPRARPQELAGGDAEANARVIRGILGGRLRGAARDIVVVNAAAALWMAEAADDLEDGVALAHDSIDSGAARDRLDEILSAKRTEVDALKKRVPADRLEALIERAGDSPRRFRDTLAAGPSPRVIAEIKHRSPSRGVIRGDFDPVACAKMYAEAGAAALSVLTDERFFGGRLEHLGDVREVVPLPLLRKDFVIDAYQIDEAAAFGADAVLLIVAALDGPRLAALREHARARGLDALVEVHDARELELARDAGADLIGINNRDLRTFETDLAVTERLAPLAPDGSVIVAESGVSTHDDVRRLEAAGAHAVLVGESLMREPDLGTALRKLRGVA